MRTRSLVHSGETGSGASACSVGNDAGEATASGTCRVRFAVNVLKKRILTRAVDIAQSDIGDSHSTRVGQDVEKPEAGGK